MSRNVNVSPGEANKSRRARKGRVSRNLNKDEGKLSLKAA